MPRRNDLHRILIIGSGPIVIGQACEFDYSGTQAAKALRADGYRGDAGQFQPGHHHDRSGSRRQDLRRAADASPTSKRSSAASGPTRCSPPWAARPA